MVSQMTSEPLAQVQAKSERVLCEADRIVQRQPDSMRVDNETTEGGKENGGPNGTQSEQKLRSGAPPTMSPEQMDQLYQNCIKLASENKISQKNTWGLRLIDHLSDLVKPSVEGGRPTTNFQRASCTLDAGIKIYSYRVDSVHNEAFKVLSGLHHNGGGTAAPDDDDGGPGEEGVEGSSGGGKRSSGPVGSSDPEATLESCTDAINIKKFDLAFAIDPLFQKTSAQFDAGGASGLLLNNLSVYNGCEIVFDSAEVPQAALDRKIPPVEDVQVDIGLLPPHVLSQARLPPQHPAMTPALTDMLRLLGEEPSADAESDATRLVSDILSDLSLAGPSGTTPASPEAFGSDFKCDHGALQDGGFSDDGRAYDDDEAANSWEGSGGDHGSVPPSGSFAAAASAGGSSDGIGADALHWLMDISHMGNSSPVTHGASWAGAAHWKYNRVPQSTENTAELKPKASARKKKAAATLDFENLPDLPEGALAVTSCRTRLAKLTRKDTLLPKDIHYEAARLSQLFLRPSDRLTRAAAAARTARRSTSAPLYDDSYGGYDNDGGGCCDGGDDGQDDGWPALKQSLLPEPPRVATLSVPYALTATQVDMKALKQSLWSAIRGARALQGGSPQPLPFGDLVANVSGVTQSGTPTAREARSEAVVLGVSVHLCFICLLHLANEHSLALADSADLATLTVMLPT